MARNRQVQFLLAIELALVVCPITLGAVIFQDKAQKVWNDDGLPIVFIACAFITAIYWFCSYSLATRRELSILEKRFTPTERARVGIKEDPPIIVAMFFGLSFGLLIAFVWNPIVFITFVIFLQMLDLAGVSYINHKIADLVKEAIWSDNARDNCLKCIYQYYIVQPQVLRCTMLLLCYVGCLAILLTWDNQLNLPVAYSVFIVTFVIGQLTINHWRKQLAQVTMTSSPSSPMPAGGGPDRRSARSPRRRRRSRTAHSVGSTESGGSGATGRTAVFITGDSVS